MRKREGEREGEKREGREKREKEERESERRGYVAWFGICGKSEDIFHTAATGSFAFVQQWRHSYTVHFLMWHIGVKSHGRSKRQRAKRGEGLTIWFRARRW